MNPTKILEISGDDLMKGISIQDTAAYGGIFQSSSYNFDPFDMMGFIRPSLESVQLDTAINKKPTCSLAVQSGGVGYVFHLADRTGGAVNNLFRTKTSDQTVTGYSLTGGSAAGARVFTGLGYVGGNIVFIDPSTAFVYRIGVGGGAETSCGGISGSGATTLPAMFWNAPDGNTYFTKGSSDGQIAKITTGYTVTDAAFTGDTDLIPKDLTDDGRFLIVIADENPTKVTAVEAKCKVYFWDMDKADADVVMSIPDSFLIGGRYVDGRLLVIGSSGIWQLAIGSTPKLILPLTAAELPLTAQAIDVKGNNLYWTSSSGNSLVYGFGSKIGKPVWFAPHISNASSYVQNTVCSSGDYIYVGVDDGASGGRAYVLNSGSTRSSATILTTPKVLAQPHKFLYAKVVLKSKLTTGQSIALALYDSEGNSIMANTTYAYNASYLKKSFKFEPKSQSGGVQEFEDIYLQVNPQVGAIVQRVTIYGTPINDNSATI